MILITNMTNNNNNNDNNNNNNNDNDDDDDNGLLYSTAAHVCHSMTLPALNHYYPGFSDTNWKFSSTHRMLT